MEPTAAIPILNRVRDWLPQTKTWIYEQLRWLPTDVRAHVVCDRAENLSQFPWPDLHVLEQAPAEEQLIDQIGRKLELPSLRSAAHLARRLSARVWHSHFGLEGFRELPLARAAGLPQVVTFYGYDVTRTPQDPIWRKRYGQLFGSVARILCEGPHMRQELIKLGAPPQKVLVQHLGVDLARFEFAQRAWAGNGSVKVLMAAGFREKKGLPYALRAVARAQQLRPELDFRVSLVGDASSDPDSVLEKREILAAAAELGERVTFLGFRPHAELAELAKVHHIFMSPSVRAKDGDTEGGAPVAIIELAAMGLPVLSTKHADIPNVLRGPASAWLAEERDVDGLVERLLGALDHPEETRGAADFVRRDLEQRFDSKKQAMVLAEVYRELAAKPRRPGLRLAAADQGLRLVTWSRAKLAAVQRSH